MGHVIAELDEDVGHHVVSGDHPPVLVEHHVYETAAGSLISGTVVDLASSANTE